MAGFGAEYENLDQKAYAVLKQMIIERKILPGEKIPQEKLAQEFGISRTPLINGLKYLENEKLVVSIPRRGYFVREFTRDEMISIFELREVLEGLAARRTAASISQADIRRLRTFFKGFSTEAPIADIRAYALEDRKFHNFITAIGSKEFLQSILETYNIITFSYQMVSLEGEGLLRSPNETLAEHLKVIEAIADRDPEAAEAAMRSHLGRTIVKLRSET
jgi:DNA-binding GntR family transcriptional regulator